MEARPFKAGVSGEAPNIGSVVKMLGLEGDVVGVNGKGIDGHGARDFEYGGTRNDEDSERAGDAQ